MLLDANLPERVTHNDTKFNNVLLDDSTGAALAPRRGRAWGTGGAAAVQLVMERVVINGSGESARSLTVSSRSKYYLFNAFTFS